MPRQPQEPNHQQATYGRGSVYQRKSDGRWVASFADPNTGKRIERYAKTGQEAMQKLEDIKYETHHLSLSEQAAYLKRKLDEVNRQLAQMEATRKH